MKNRIYLLIPLLAILLAIPAGAVEFDTSTGEENIVLMSTDGEVNMGDSLSKSVEQQFRVIKDEAAQKKVDEIGQKIAAVCGRKDIIYHFKVIDLKGGDRMDNGTPIINAFSLPGGYVYVFKDLYDKVKNDDELAGVIAHEVSHIVARHSAKRLQAAFGANIFMILATQTQTDARSFNNAAAAINTLMSSYSRNDEIFADKLAVKYTKAAHYNPEGVASFLQVLLDIEQKEPIRPYISQRSHPYLSIRIPSVKKEIYGKMDFNDYINTPTETMR